MITSIVLIPRDLQICHIVEIICCINIIVIRILSFSNLNYAKNPLLMQKAHPKLSSRTISKIDVERAEITCITAMTRRLTRTQWKRLYTAALSYLNGSRSLFGWRSNVLQICSCPSYVLSTNLKQIRLMITATLGANFVPPRFPKTAVSPETINFLKRNNWPFLVRTLWNSLSIILLGG